MSSGERQTTEEQEGLNSRAVVEVINPGNLLENLWIFLANPLAFLRNMANAHSKVAVYGTVLAVGASIMAYVYLKNSEGGGARNDYARLQSMKEVNERRFKEIQEKMEKERREFEAEQRREEEKMWRLQEQRKQESKERMYQNMKRMADDEKRYGMKREFDRQQSEENYAKKKMDIQLDNFLKDQMIKVEVNALQGKLREELNDMEENIARNRERNQEKLDADHVKMQENRRVFEKRQVEQQKEMQEEKERFERRIEEIRQRLAEELEEMHRRDEQRRFEMEAQLREIQRILRNRMWNEIIENNWTRRLNTLRSANKDVHSIYRSMQSHSGNREMQEMHKRNLLEAIDSERKLMESESREMEQMYSSTGKAFLLEIKEAVDNVRNSCDQFRSSIQRGQPETDNAFRELSHSVSAIPTLAELKRNYAESMRKGS